MEKEGVVGSGNLEFAWDRVESAASLREKLAEESVPSWSRAASWLMREARTTEVWQFLTLEQVDRNFDRLRPLLGRQRAKWEYLLRVAHELGRI